MPDPSPRAWAGAIRDAAVALGFCRVGFTPIEPLPDAARALQAWLDAGRHGDMAYMAAHARRDDPAKVLAEARSLVVVALAYPRGDARAGREQAAAPATGFIARYARGADYHGVLKQKLQALAAACSEIVGRPVLARPCVDSAPLLERGYAARAGVGFTAKSTLAIVPGQGSYILLGELLLDVEVSFDAAIRPRCGSCRACLDVCPTGAFVAPYVLDARRCISYLTIELRGAIPRHLRPLIGNMIFGCDLCQEVCPFNASPKPRPTAPELSPRPQFLAPDLRELLSMGSAAYRKWVRGTAMRRVSRTQMARNAAVALGNCGEASVVPSLAQTLATDARPLVRGHAAWALGRLGGALAWAALRGASEDADPFVRDEVEAALSAVSTARCESRHAP